MRRVAILAVLLACRSAAPSPPATSPGAAVPPVVPSVPLQVTPAPTRPLTDRDADAVPDPSDRCPDEPEDRDQFEDDDGCPDRDNDGDKILDAHEFKDGRWTNCDHKIENGVDVDCRNLPEEFDGDQDHDGCPEQRCLDQCPSKVADNAHFDGRGRFDAAAASRFAEVAHLLARSPRTHIWVDVHADAPGDAKAAQQLTERVAAATIAELLRLGVPAKQARPRAMGQRVPLTRPRSAAGRADLRRVEFNIMRYRGCCGDAPPDSPDPPRPQECR